jgi:threonine/homoserine efflux transporter RhtA
MEISTLLAQQFTDIFRLGLLVGLIYTTERTRSQTGVLLPLIAGVIFVAVIIPSTMPGPDVPLWTAIATGIVVNAVVVAVFWLAWQAYSRSRRS